MNNNSTIKQDLRYSLLYSCLINLFTYQWPSTIRICLHLVLISRLISFFTPKTSILPDRLFSYSWQLQSDACSKNPNLGIMCCWIPKRDCSEKCEALLCVAKINARSEILATHHAKAKVLWRCIWVELLLMWRRSNYKHGSEKGFNPEQKVNTWIHQVTKALTNYPDWGQGCKLVFAGQGPR